jgi:hypothetical protein
MAGGLLADELMKTAAKIQWATRSGLPVLLRFDRKSGPYGGDQKPPVRPA